MLKGGVIELQANKRRRSIKARNYVMWKFDFLIALLVAVREIEFPDCWH
jgi:hypothetical protein